MVEACNNCLARNSFEVIRVCKAIEELDEKQRKIYEFLLVEVNGVVKTWAEAMYLLVERCKKCGYIRKVISSKPV